jgi:hypothetical protein
MYFGNLNNKTYTTALKVENIKDWGNSISILSDNNWYSYWKKEEYKDFEEKIKVGNEIAVYVVEKKKNGRTYFNITPNLFSKQYE